MVKNIILVVATVIAVVIIAISGTIAELFPGNNNKIFFKRLLIFIMISVILCLIVYFLSQIF